MQKPHIEVHVRINEHTVSVSFAWPNGLGRGLANKDSWSVQGSRNANAGSNLEASEKRRAVHRRLIKHKRDKRLKLNPRLMQYPYVPFQCAEAGVDGPPSGGANKSKLWQVLQEQDFRITYQSFKYPTVHRVVLLVHTKLL